ncbi:MAG: transglutaminase [Gomphosphaeria aponina SAG 52.96 = DSM 107014]|uniref:Transglutaminase n=1 Tax=Gomphosphaeria aponina SAG 52.96 = DSM 107014 TaxID=1521640 RepID=A0A941JUS5_9CHRO|nr:transglutaminase [Gomphosphaeria aponina SAG 52.96 = DSM 107014]
MTTEREYREWQAKRKKYQRQHNSNFSPLLILGIIFISGWYTWKHHPQEINNFLARILPPQLPFPQPNNPNANIGIKSNADIKIGSELPNMNYDKIDKVAASIKYNGTSVTELASILSQLANSEVEKARIIYAWLAHNITYDVQGYLTGNYGDLSPLGVLKSRKGVCSGYANLYQALAQEMGLEAVIIDGYAKGASYILGEKTQVNHAWNGVKINDAWYLVDATWGAGYVNGGQFYQAFNPHYFATAPQEFIYDHLPSKTTWQLLAQPYSKEQFELLPNLSPQFFNQGMKFISHNKHTITAKDGQVEIILQAHPDTIVASALQLGGQKLPETYTFEQQQNGQIFIKATFPAPGNYELQIYAKNKHESGSYPHAVTYKIIADAAGKEFPKIYTNFTENNANLQAPLTKKLPSNQSVYFQLNVPKALEVQVIDQTSNKWTKLTRSGNQFSGNAFVGSGKVQVTAKFPGDEKYWTVVEYN